MPINNQPDSNLTQDLYNRYCKEAAEQHTCYVEPKVYSDVALRELESTFLEHPEYLMAPQLMKTLIQESINIAFEIGYRFGKDGYEIQRDIACTVHGAPAQN